ncbi:2'-5' RNA ligase family protein [Rhodoflexus sp.]
MPSIAPNWFVALPVRPTEHLLEALAETAPPQVRLFAPDDTHLTIAFMGAMPKERVQDVLNIMEEIDFDPFTIRLAKLIPLPSPKHTSALSYTVGTGNEIVVALIKQWRDLLLSAGGAAPDKRPPLPHLTIGRPLRKFGNHAQEIGRQWAAQLPTIAFEAKIESVALYTWSDDRRYNQFKIVAERVVHTKNPAKE